jgi:hypothetical protein
MTHFPQGLAYLQTPDYNVDQVTSQHPSRPMTLYKGPHSLFRALAPKYQLNKAEYLQLYNLRPSTGVALELIIEEVRSVARFQNTGSTSSRLLFVRSGESCESRADSSTGRFPFQ